MKCFGLSFVYDTNIYHVYGIFYEVTFKLFFFLHIVSLGLGTICCKDYLYPSEMLLHLCQKSMSIFVCLLLESLLCSFSLFVHFEDYNAQF